MTPALADLGACFEGVVPSVISTLSAEGVPNISYLSHVVPVDDRHIALSNQFFSKTGSNLRAVPKATILLVDGRTGRQFRVEALFVRSQTTGPVFDRVAAHLAASSAQVGMSSVMQLRSVDIFLVTAITDVVSEPETDMLAVLPGCDPDFETLARITQDIAAAEGLGAVVEAALSGVLAVTPSDAASVLLTDPQTNVLTLVGSRGYVRSGVGSETGIGEGVAGLAAREGRPICVNDLSRIRRFGAAIQTSAVDENLTRTIPLPGLDGALSQLAVPIRAQGRVIGVILAESRKRLAYLSPEEAIGGLLANVLGPAVALAEFTPAELRVGQKPAPVRAHDYVIEMQHHAQDDSVFVQGDYIIKGVAGRLLVFLVQSYLASGRLDFTNREVRLAEEMRLPGYRDNLETRLLLLQRRLEDRAAPIRISRPGRGQICLEISGKVMLRRS